MVVIVFFIDITERKIKKNIGYYKLHITDYPVHVIILKSRYLK